MNCRSDIGHEDVASTGVGVGRRSVEGGDDEVSYLLRAPLISLQTASMAWSALTEVRSDFCL